jgi:hypothetical protein
MSGYMADVNRIAEAYGPGAETPRTSGYHPELTRMTEHVTPRLDRETPASRIASLAKQATEAAERLAEARNQYERASSQRHKCEAEFASVSEQLVRAIHEHREGTPENVPYQS